jgi:hypothetical protein
MGATPQIGKAIGKEAALDAVEAKVKPIGARRGGQRVGARLLVAGAVLSHGGDELAGDEGEGFEVVEDEFEVVSLREL